MKKAHASLSSWYQPLNRYSFLILVMLLSKLGVVAQHITLSMTNCQAVGNNQLQFDVVVLNDGTVPIKFNSAVIRFAYGNAPMVTNGTISWGNVTSNIAPNWAAAGFYTITASTRICNFSSSTGFWTTAATAPDLPINVPVTLGRFYFQTSTFFTPSVLSQLSWSNTAGIVGWVNGSPTTSSLNTSQTRTLASPCNILLNTSTTLICPTSVNATVTNPVCYNTSGSVQINLSPASSNVIGTYSVNGGTAVNYTNNQFPLTGLSGGSYTITVSPNGTCSPVTTAYTVGNAPTTPTTNTSNVTACSYYVWPVNGVTYTSSGTYTGTSINSSNCTVLETLNLTLSPGHLELATVGNTSSVVGSSVVTNTLSNNTSVLFLNGCNYTATLTDGASGVGMGATSLNTFVDPSLPLLNTQVYCPRHYTIDPTNNEQGSVTFYVAQDDFDDYNAANGNYLDMNATTLKLHRITNNGSSINSIPATCSWNAVLNRYEVTCSPNLINGDYYFYTELPCQSNVSNINVTNITATSAVLSWNSVAGAIGYSVRYRVLGATLWSQINALVTTQTLTGLFANTIYEYQVRFTCSSGQNGSWSTPGNFVTILNACSPPNTPVTSNITSTSATITWIPIPNAGYYVVQYRKVTNPVASWITISNVMSNSFTLNNLNPGNIYQVKVAQWCTNNSVLSSYSPAALFATTGTAACPSPINLTASYTATTAAFTWTAVPGSISYNLRYRQTPMGAWSIISSFTNSVGGNNLIPVTNYEVQVRTNCSSNGNFSSWSPSYYFTTPILKPANTGGGYELSIVGGNDKGNTQVYPNPVSSQLNIHYMAMEAGELRFQLVDVTGRGGYKHSLQGKEGMNPLEINMTDFAKGVYHLHIMENGKMSYQEKVMKQ
jgi:hypothetical protein